MAFPLTRQEAIYIANRRFALRVGTSTTDATSGAAYALDEGVRVIVAPYINWDCHLNNTLLKIQGFEGSEKKHLLFISPAYGTGERYLIPDNVGVHDSSTFPKANSIGTRTIEIHASMPIGHEAVARLMTWVFACINRYGPETQRTASSSASSASSS